MPCFYDIYGPLSNRKRCRFDRPGQWYVFYCVALFIEWRNRKHAILVKYESRCRSFSCAYKRIIIHGGLDFNLSSLFSYWYVQFWRWNRIYPTKNCNYKRIWFTYSPILYLDFSTCTSSRSSLSKKKRIWFTHLSLLYLDSPTCWSSSACNKAAKDTTSWKDYGSIIVLWMCTLVVILSLICYASLGRLPRGRITFRRWLFGYLERSFYAIRQIIPRFRRRRTEATNAWYKICSTSFVSNWRCGRFFSVSQYPNIFNKNLTSS